MVSLIKLLLGLVGSQKWISDCLSIFGLRMNKLWIFEALKIVYQKSTVDSHEQKLDILVANKLQLGVVTLSNFKDLPSVTVKF